MRSTFGDQMGAGKEGDRLGWAGVPGYSLMG